MLRRVIIVMASMAGAWAVFGQSAGADYPPVPPTVTTTIAPTTTVAPTTTTTKPPKLVSPTTVAATVPKKVAPTIVKVVPRPEVVVVVREVPVRPRRALVFTGTDSAIPLTALATASVGLGVTLVCLTRLRWPGRRRRRHHRRFA